MQAAGAAAIGEVALGVRRGADLGRERRHARRVGAPGLAGVVRREALHEHVRAELAQPAGDGVADPGAAAHAGDERAAAGELAQSPSSRAYVRRYCTRASSTRCT